MATEINGAKMQLIVDDLISTASTGNEEWDKKDIASRPDWVIKGSELRVQPYYWEFYMRRRDIYYFRSILGKIKFEATDLPDGHETFKYGEEYIIEFPD